VARDETIAFLAGDVARAFRQSFEAALAEEGLEVTVGEARTLYHASRAALRQTQLAERMGIEPMTLVNFLDRLESRGWIAREPDPADRRATIVRVTPAANRHVERLEKVATEVRGRAALGLSAHEMETLRKTLEHVRANLYGSQTERDAAA
jgi:DNA-binding MarR family transcriptional regulator